MMKYVFLIALLFPMVAPHAATGVPVLMYHEITDDSHQGDPTHVSLAKFREQMEWLAEHDYRTISLDELLAYIDGSRIPARAFVLNFDDGWKSQLQVLPILRQYGFTASFFIFPGLGVEDPWGDYVTWKELRSISDDPLFEVQAHSMTHPWNPDNNFVTWAEGKTPGKGLADVDHELRESRALLEQRLDIEVKYFAWPAGFFNDDLVELADRAGYIALFTVCGGLNQPGEDTQRIRRMFVDGSGNLDDFRQLLDTDELDRCPDL